MRLLRSIVIFFRRADTLLLTLCLAASLLGVLICASTTAHFGTNRFVIVQLAAIAIGVAVYVLLSLLDIDILADQSTLLILFDLLFLSTLFFWGVEGNTGNRSWLEFSWLPFNIQPAEICKVPFIIVNAKLMRSNRQHISQPKPVLKLLLHTLITVGVILLASDDMGVALIYVFIFLVMAYAGGISRYWFLAALGAAAAAAPLLWFVIMRQDQKNRILALFDPSVDPSGSGILWQTNLSLRSIQNGGFTGQGLFSGSVTQSGINPQQHNDFVFSAIAEEFGAIGCIVVLLLLFAIILRCIYVGVKSGSYMNRLICTGIAAMMIFQITVNVGMCLGLFPVVGLTLPFFSYGGSSILATYFAMGVVSGIRLRPSSDGSAVYVRPPENR